MTLAERAVEVGLTQVGVKEVGTNSGPEVDAYLAEVGLPPGFAWCAAYVSWCIKKGFEAGTDDVGPPQFVHSAGALGILHQNPHLRMAAPDMLPCIAVEDHGGGKGHTYFVLSVDGDKIESLEGNTNEAGSREGNAVVHKLDQRRVSRCAGFVRIG